MTFEAPRGPEVAVDGLLAVPCGSLWSAADRAEYETDHWPGCATCIGNFGPAPTSGQVGTITAHRVAIGAAHHASSTRLENPDTIEAKVAATRDLRLHIARAVTVTERVYILHSQECLDSGRDLRDCEFSVALDRGIDPTTWSNVWDLPVTVGIDSTTGLLDPRGVWRVVEPMPPAPAGFVACRVIGPSSLTTHLVALDDTGSNGGRPTVCGLTRFGDTADLPGWGLGDSGVKGPGIAQNKCEACYATVPDKEAPHDR